MGERRRLLGCDADPHDRDAGRQRWVGSRSRDAGNDRGRARRRGSRVRTEFLRDPDRPGSRRLLRSRSHGVRLDTTVWEVTPDGGLTVTTPFAAPVAVTTGIQVSAITVAGAALVGRRRGRKRDRSRRPLDPCRRRAHRCDSYRARRRFDDHAEIDRKSERTCRRRRRVTTMARITIETTTGPRLFEGEGPIRIGRDLGPARGRNRRRAANGYAGSPPRPTVPWTMASPRPDPGLVRIDHDGIDHVRRGKSARRPGS